MSEFPTWLTATLASDAAEGQGVLPNTILPLSMSPFLFRKRIKSVTRRKYKYV
jgi:hypothetical protein